MYWKDVWRLIGSNEIEIKYAGKYGAKGEKRAKKKKATPDQIKKQNQANREKKMRRLIGANFQKDDLWATMKYPKGTRKTVGEVMKDVRNFNTAMRKAFRKAGAEYRYIYRVEIGERGGIHIHFLIGRQGIRDIDILIQHAWKHGRVNHTTLYDEGGYEKLANYIVKQPEEEENTQLSLFEENDKRQLLRYHTSRNLIRPQPERKEYRRWTVRKLVQEGPKPTPGYYIDKNSIHSGINRYTGMTYYHYTEIRLPEKGGDG